MEEEEAQQIMEEMREILNCEQQNFKYLLSKDMLMECLKQPIDKRDAIKRDNAKRFESVVNRAWNAAENKLEELMGRCALDPEVGDLLSTSTFTDLIRRANAATLAEERIAYDKSGVDLESDAGQKVFNQAMDELSNVKEDDVDMFYVLTTGRSIKSKAAKATLTSTKPDVLKEAKECLAKQLDASPAKVVIDWSDDEKKLIKEAQNKFEPLMDLFMAGIPEDTKADIENQKLPAIISQFKSYCEDQMKKFTEQLEMDPKGHVTINPSSLRSASTATEEITTKGGHQVYLLATRKDDKILLRFTIDLLPSTDIPLELNFEWIMDIC